MNGLARRGRTGVSVLAVAWLIVSVAGMPTLGSQTQGQLIGVGYYVDYDASSWTTLTTYGRVLHTVITTNYVVADQTGRLEGRPEPKVLQLVRSRGTRVLVRVSNDAGGEFSRPVAHAVLTVQAARAAFLAGITALIEREGYDGVNIDLENVPPQDRAALSAFIRELASRLRPRGKMVTLAVPAKTSDSPDNDWNGAFDYAALAQAADWLILMAYDEHWLTSAPGPIASLPWVENVARYATSVAPRGRLLLGVAFYGYDWPGRGAAEGISMREALQRAERARADVAWDERAQAPYFAAGDRRVYFENARSVERKAAVAARYGVAGIAAWRLGHELPEVWSALDPYLRPITQPTR